MKTKQELEDKLEELHDEQETLKVKRIVDTIDLINLAREMQRYQNLYKQQTGEYWRY